MTDATTQDAFLNGKVVVTQPRHGFRSGIDAVLLAASVPAKTGESVLELGCGVGVAALCLHARVPGLVLTGVEVQDDYAALARQNVTSNQAAMTVETADLRKLPVHLRQQQFHHVMMNPPYYDRASGSAANDAGRDIALGGGTPLADWIDIGVKRLAPKGTFTLIQHITRLPEVLAGLQERLGSISLQPLSGRRDQAPNLFLIQAKHSGRAPFQMRPVVPLHEGDAHQGDFESYTPAVREILRYGAEFPMSD